MSDRTGRNMLSLILAVPLLAACVGQRCERAAPYLQAGEGPGLTVPADLEGYERDPSMAIPEGELGTEVQRRRADAGTCLEAPPPFEASRADTGEETSSGGEASEAGMVPAEAPAAGDVTDSSAAGGPEAEVRAALANWAAAWSAQDTERFFAAYAGAFQPADGLSRQDWRSWKADQIEAPRWVSVELGEVEIQMLDEDRAIAVFNQRYSSETAAETSDRVMELQKTEDGWLIVAEADARNR